MIRVAISTAGILLFTGLAVCALRESTDRADFAYLNTNGINTLDPAAITWNQDIRVALNIWEGLTATDPVSSTPVAAAATQPRISNDGLLYTFRIRPNARWSNGDAVTAADFLRGWRRAIEPGTAGDYAFFITQNVAGAADYYAWRNASVARLSSLRVDSDEWRTRFSEHARTRNERFARVGLRALDRRRFEVRLAKPCAYFLDLCAFVTLVPIHESIERLRVDHAGSGITKQGLVVYDPQWTKPDYHTNAYPGLITNGAYTPTRWTFKRRLRMVKNPHYHLADRRPDAHAPQTIDMMVYGDANTAIMAYEAGALDFLPETGVSYDHELARLALTGERTDLHCLPVFATYYYLFNCVDTEINGKPNPFVDPRVRKAFALAIDRRLIAERVTGRGEPPTSNIVPPDSIPGYTSLPGLSYDPDTARTLLADAGYPSGSGLPPIDLLYNTGAEHGKVCDAMAEMWRRELGAIVAARGKESKTFAEDRKHRRFMIARAGWYGDYADPTTFLDLFATDNGNNDAGHSDPAFDDLLSRAARTIDAAKRMDLLARAESRILNDTVPALPLFRHTQLLAIKPHVHGLHPNPRLIFPFRLLSIEP